MKNESKSLFARLTDKLYGGLPMTWPAVILYAVATAVLTALFLIVPLFSGTSFARVGETLEAWIFFAVIIMANCKSPLESALKTFVFFLISQPLIYLLQVPFSWMGWGLFGYYRYWFILTLATFPAAFVGWYITKKNWLSVAIFAPVLCFLAATGFSTFRETTVDFPKYLLTTLFCFAQILLYILVFFPALSQKVVGLVLTAATVVIFALRTPQVALSVVESLPDTPALSQAATVSLEDAALADVKLTIPEDATVYITAHKYGATTMTVTDGEKAYRYSLEVYQGEGSDQIRIVPAEE